MKFGRCRALIWRRARMCRRDRRFAQARAQHQALVNAKFLRGLSLDEEDEMERLGRIMDACLMTPAMHRTHNWVTFLMARREEKNDG